MGFIYLFMFDFVRSITVWIGWMVVCAVITAVIGIGALIFQAARWLIRQVTKSA